MNSLQVLPWQEPLDVAQTIADEYWVLLYSGVKTSYSGRYSYLAHDLKEQIKAEDFDKFSGKLSNKYPWYKNAWFGYLGYGLKDCLEEFPAELPSTIALPSLWMIRFACIWRFDHEKKIIERWSEEGFPQTISPLLSPLPTVTELGSNMAEGEYLQSVKKILEHIQAGDLYQANLTRKFYGKFKESSDGFSLFRSLCNASPAPYSAFLKLGESYILSSSPELFLRIDETGEVRTRPIKGTAPRFTEKKADEISRKQLSKSNKDKAENLMIVDLMRNDLSRGCIPGSIKTTDMFEVTSHSRIHHMSTTIHGKKQPDCSTLDFVRHCFPPGSMTGAPKIRAIGLCSEIEKQSRGVYAGAIGFFDGAGGCELSVVIRTLLLQDNRFEFQVGGGIVADSTPEAEKQETFDKAGGLLSALGITKNSLSKL